MNAYENDNSNYTYLENLKSLQTFEKFEALAHDGENVLQAHIHTYKCVYGDLNESRIQTKNLLCRENRTLYTLQHTH